MTGAWHIRRAWRRGFLVGFAVALILAAVVLILAAERTSSTGNNRRPTPAPARTWLAGNFADPQCYRSPAAGNVPGAT